MDNEIPSLDELKNELGEDIVYFIDFISGADMVLYDIGNSDNCNNTLPDAQPVSGHAIYYSKGSDNEYGSLGVCIAGSKKVNFATTCYHVCCCGKVSKRNPAKMSRQLELDSTNRYSKTKSARYLYKCKSEEERNEKKQKHKNKKGSYKEIEYQTGKDECGSNCVDDNKAGVDCHGVSSKLGKYEDEKLSGIKENMPNDILKTKKEGEMTDGKKIKKENKEGKKEESKKGKEKKKSRAEKQSKGRMLGKFSWGVHNLEHDFALIQLEDNELNCICQMRSIQQIEEVASKQTINEMYRQFGFLTVEKTGFTTGTTEGKLTMIGVCFSLRGRCRKLKNCYVVEDKDDTKPFSAKGDSGSAVTIVRPSDNKKILFSYVTCAAAKKIPEKKAAKIEVSEKKATKEEKRKTICLSLRSSLDLWNQNRKQDMKLEKKPPSYVKPTQRPEGESGRVGEFKCILELATGKLN